MKQSCRSGKADCCRIGGENRHTAVQGLGGEDRQDERQMKMKDDDGAEGFDGVRGGSGICLVDIVGSEFYEICRIGVERSADKSDKLQTGSEESCAVGRFDDRERVKSICV